MKTQFEKIPNVSIDRLYDITTGYKNQNNICDFIVYQRPNILYLECKSIHGNTLNFKSDIRENQWQGLLQKSKIPGVLAGIICWFVDKDITVYLDIQELERLKKNNYKSYNITKAVPTIVIYGKKKRVFYEYDLERFLEEVKKI